MFFVEITLICLAIAVIAGLTMSRLTKLLHLPAVTAYLVAGILVGPFCLGAIGVPGLGFGSLEQVEGFSLITQVALGFIAFAIGNEFRMCQLKTMGKKAVTIGIVQAVATTLLVDVVLVGLAIAFPKMLSIPAALTLGAIASATAPTSVTVTQGTSVNTVVTNACQSCGRTFVSETPLVVTVA